jgi:hypothetical protein
MAGIDIFLRIMTRIFWKGKGRSGLVRIKIEKVGPLNADEIV